MDKTLHTDAHLGPQLPDIHLVEATRPFKWLAAGWRDIAHSPVTALVYGAVFALLGWGLYSLSDGAPHFILTYVAGFFLVGPFLASGLYAVAHRLEHHHPATLYHAVTAWHRSGLQMVIYTALIGFLMVFWVRLAWLLVGLMYTQGPAVSIGELLGSATGLEYMALYLALGGIFAALVFAISVVALPMLQDRRVDIITAMLTSLTVVKHNPGAMAVWAALIVGLCAIGFATYLVGLVVIFPLLGYATWHAYRDLVPRHHE